MAKEEVTARLQEKDENNNAILDGDGAAVWKEAKVEFDFGDTLDAAIELCGADVVFSQYKANARVALQSIIRASLKAGLTVDQIQEKVNGWKPGMVMEKVQIDPQVAIRNAFATWSPEKKAEFLKGLGVEL